MKRRTSLLLAIFISTISSSAVYSPINAAPSPLLKALRQFDRNVCKSIPASCKARARKRVKQQHTARHAKAPAKIQAKIEDAKPVPAESAPKTEAVVAPTPVAVTVKPPIPRTKPVIPAAVKVEKAAPKVDKQVAIVAPKPIIFPKVAIPEKSKPDVAGDNCLQQLRDVGASFVMAPEYVSSGQCNIVSPVHLKAVRAQKDVVELPEAPLLNCKFALQFSKWIKESGAPILSAQMNSPLEKLATGPGYECRGRNGDGSAKISEHGYGNAVDITTFRMRGGAVVNVADAQNSSAASYSILRGLRASACGYFTTVLGPGSNEAHKTHFHFDLGAHGKTGNYRICE